MKRVLALCICILICSCSPYAIYRINVRQGNAISEEQIAALKPGMPKQQVAYLMGSPVTENTFSPDRWEYVQTTQIHSTLMTRKIVILEFKNDRLDKISR